MICESRVTPDANKLFVKDRKFTRRHTKSVSSKIIPRTRCNCVTLIPIRKIKIDVITLIFITSFTHAWKLYWDKLGIIRALVINWGWNVFCNSALRPLTSFKSHNFSIVSWCTFVKCYSAYDESNLDWNSGQPTIKDVTLRSFIKKSTAVLFFIFRLLNIFF